MDNKEAIEILNITCGKRLYVTDNKEEERKLVQAFNMAIAALRDSQPNWKKAPKWANWCGRQCSGELIYYENKPNLTYAGFCATEGQRQYEFREDWVTLYQRPISSPPKSPKK